jgi:K+ transporter
MMPADLGVSVTPAGLLDASLPIPRFPGLGTFYTDTASAIPGVFAHLVNNIHSIPECVVFATINYVNFPHIEEKDRLFVTNGLLNGFWKAVVTLGYMDEIIDSDWITDEVIAAISRVESRFQSTSASSTRMPPAESTGGSLSFSLGGKPLVQEPTADAGVSIEGEQTSEDLTRSGGGPRSAIASYAVTTKRIGRISYGGPVKVADAESDGVVYFLGKRRYVAKEESSIWHRFLVSCYEILVLFSRAGSSQLDVPDDQAIEVGLRVRL